MSTGNRETRIDWTPLSMLLSAVVGAAGTLLAAHWNLIKPSDNQVEKLYERLEAERQRGLKDIQQQLADKTKVIDELREKIEASESKLRTCQVEKTPVAAPQAETASPMDQRSIDALEKPADSNAIDIDWATNAEKWSRRLGQKFQFRCPPNGLSGDVSGTRMYTWDSSICTAAVHAGKINGASGGIVTVRIYGAGEAENSSNKNGVHSDATRSNVLSFVFE